MGFFPIQILIFQMLRNNADVRQYFELGLPVLAWNRIGRRSGDCAYLWKIPSNALVWVPLCS